MCDCRSICAAHNECFSHDQNQLVASVLKDQYNLVYIKKKTKKKLWAAAHSSAPGINMNNNKSPV